MNVQKTLIIVKPAVTADLILSKKAEVEILKLGYTIIAVMDLLPILSFQ